MSLTYFSQSNIKVILAVLFPPTILLLDFKKPTYPTKTRKELHSTNDSEESEDIKLNGSVFNISLNSVSSISVISPWVLGIPGIPFFVPAK